ncbi:hypothetical protein [Mesorhizobium sp.]|uniref:hypothetical protein n=1 Tax=Mesorhizobium sp. TaxID=1871066 RepID=UPI000FEA8641|nr:hypothetical protein [Mesorhizobium sp.]RWQ61479.1 MAG: hypothetical protein EOS86_32910 [Mesorhizobium sp.]
MLLLERAAIECHLGLINQINEALTVVERISRWCPLGSDNPSPDDVASDVTLGANVAAAIGNIRRFSDPQRLVAYLGFFRACGSR